MKQAEEIHNSRLVAALNEAPDKPATVAMLREVYLALELKMVKIVKASEECLRGEMKDTRGEIKDLGNKIFCSALAISAAILAAFLQTG